LAKKQGIKVEERNISTEEFFIALAEGRVQEAFGAGTAATIAPIIGVGFKDKHYELPAIETREISRQIKQELFAIKSGETNDEMGWIMKIETGEKVNN
jgi:branched-chain amino acid aminotransferase